MSSTHEAAHIVPPDTTARISFRAGPTAFSIDDAPAAIVCFFRQGDEPSAYITGIGDREQLLALAIGAVLWLRDVAEIDGAVGEVVYQLIRDQRDRALRRSTPSERSHMDQPSSNPQKPHAGGLNPDAGMAHREQQPIRVSAEETAEADAVRLRSFNAGVRGDLHDRIDRDFRYHAPKEGQVERYTRIREMGRSFAHQLVEDCPPSRELSRALTALEDVVMNANAAIARNE